MTYNEKLAKRLRTRMASVRGSVEKSMFGGIGFLLNGNMACGVNKEDLIVRLSEADFPKALKRPHVRVFNMTGRPMRGWIMVSEPGYKADRDLQHWVDMAVAHVKTLAPK